MKTSRQRLGQWGETWAADYLAACGYIILERNARTPYGEIDLVARQELRIPWGQNRSAIVTVFVEVKTRSTRSFGYPEESITARKRGRMLAAAQAYLQEHPELEGDWRIDVIAIECRSSKQEPAIVHFENALHE